MSAFRFASKYFFSVGGKSASVLAAASAVASSSSLQNNENDRTTIHVPYLLIGGGTASYFAALSIRARDPNAKVLIIGKESESPYNRSVLSKEFWWYGDANTLQRLNYKSLSGRHRDIRYEADGFYPSVKEVFASNDFPDGAVSLVRNAVVSRIDAVGKFAMLEDGRRVTFDKCLIATGSQPKTLPLFSDGQLSKYVTTLSTINDFRRIYHVLEHIKSDGNSRRVAIVGSGLLGTELAYSLQRHYAGTAVSEKEPLVEIYQITNDKGVLAGFMPNVLVEHANKQMKEIGVKVLTECELQTAKENENGTIGLTFLTPSGAKIEIEFDHILLDAGAEPNLDLARNSNLPLDEKLSGIRTNEEFHVTDSIWAAGDVCAFQDKYLHRQRRLEHWEHAQTSGRFAGANMTGARQCYTHQAGFETIFGRTEHVHAVGEIDAYNLDTITYLMASPPGNSSNFKENDNDYLKAVVFYVEKEADLRLHIIGVLLLNIFSTTSIEIARKIICDGELHCKEELDDLVKLFDIFYERELEDEINNDDRGVTAT